MFKKLVKHNIISYDGQFFCYLCMRVVSSFEDALLHIDEKKHLVLKSNQTFNMKNCTRETYRILADNNVGIIKEYSFMCIPCQKNIIEINNTLQHIQSKCHVKNLTNKDINCDRIKNAIQNIPKFNLQTRKLNVLDIKLLLEDLNAYQKRDSYTDDECNEYILSEVLKILHNYSKKTYKILITNGIVIYEYYRLICQFCNCTFEASDHILQHISGQTHESKKQSIKQKNNEKKESTITLSNIVKIKKEQLNLKVEKCETCSSSSCDKNCLKIMKQNLLDNGVVIRGSNDFLCTLCQHKIKSLHDILTHVKGKSHKSMLKSKNLNLTTLKDCTSTKQIVVDCSNSTIDLDITQKHNLSNYIYNTSHNTSISTNNVYKSTFLTDDSNEDKNNEILDTNKNDTVLQNSFHHCELCNMEIDINNLGKHLNTETHTSKIFSMNIGYDIFLYKCFCCKSIMYGNSLLINHLCSKSHLNNLTNHLKQFETNSTEVFAVTFNNIQNMLKNKNFPLYAVLLPKIQNACTYFNEECLISYDISDIKYYDSIKNNVVYRCLICSITLNTYHNLVSHSRAKMHLSRIKKLLGLESRSSDNNIDKITKQISEVSINDKNQNNLINFDDEFIITNDVNAQITKLLNTPPFDTKNNICIPDKHKEEKISPARRLNEVYKKEYLKVEEKMYTVQQKLNSIKVNLRLLVPLGRNDFYCLACDKKVSQEFNLLYEHICLESHMMQINEIEKNEKTKRLASEFMKQVSECIQCYLCKKFVQHHEFDAHITNMVHRNRHKMFVKIINNTFNSISQNLNNLWYSIQRFCCVLCTKTFNYKMEFIKHIIEIHNKSSDMYMFNFCIPCTTLWLDRTDSYTKHCNDIIHKYLIKNQDFMVKDLPESIKKLLIQVDEISDILFQQTQILSNDNITQEVKLSLENILKLKFPAVKAFVFGSRVTGLGFATSDIDIYIDCGNTYKQDKDKYLEKNHLIEIEQILHQYKEEWDVREILNSTRTPIIKVVYKRTGIHCDICDINGLSVENSKLIRSYNDAYLPCRKLILFIKKWFSHFDLPENCGIITSYALAWLVIFYLQLDSRLPSVATLIKQKNDSRLICGWETGVAQPKSYESDKSISTLLVGFFKFYASFDYQHYIICPLMGQSLAKEAFIELHMLPEEMKPYIRHLSTSKNPEYFRIESPLCVQDPFDLSHNLTKATKSITLKYFKQYCQDSLSILLLLKK